MTANKGSFQKGKSGNPGGRPKRNSYIEDLAREHSEAAIKRLAQWMRSNNARASVAACSALLDRAWGKPAQAVEHSGALAMTHEQALAAIDNINDDTGGEDASA